MERDDLQGRIQDFFLGGGALVSCSTLTPVNHIVFFLQIVPGLSRNGPRITLAYVTWGGSQESRDTGSRGDVFVVRTSKPWVIYDRFTVSFASEDMACGY